MLKITQNTVTKPLYITLSNVKSDYREYRTMSYSHVALVTHNIENRK